MKPTLKAFAGLAAAAALAASAFSSAQAQEFPPEQIRVVVPFTPGGGTDVITRMVTEGLAKAWDVNVIVDNRIGAGGVVGSQWVTQQKPDGRTFLAVASAFAVRAAIDPKVPYDVTKDFEPVGQMAVSPSFLVVSPDRGFQSLKDLIEYAKKQPQGIHYATAGVGSTAHMHAAAVAHLAGLNATHVPYRGTPEAVNDAMAGRVLYAFAPGPNAIPLAKAGRLKILVTTSPAGANFMPGVPSIRQAGLDYEGDDWFGVFAPAGTPLAMREKMANEMAKILADPKIRERLAGMGAEPRTSGPGEFGEMVRAYVAKMRKLGQDIGIKPH